MYSNIYDDERWDDGYRKSRLMKYTDDASVRCEKGFFVYGTGNRGDVYQKMEYIRTGFLEWLDGFDYWCGVCGC